MTEAVLTAVVERGDLAHLALLLWAGSASTLAALLLKELSATNRRFSQFVDEIERLNQIFNDHDGG